MTVLLYQQNALRGKSWVDSIADILVDGMPAPRAERYVGTRLV